MRAHEISLAALLTALVACDTPTETVTPTAPTPAPPAQVAPPAPAAVSAGVVAYQDGAEALIALIDGSAADEQVGQSADALVTLGLALLPDMVEAHPECAAYLDAIAEVGPRLKHLPLDEIEAGYHKDGALPEMPSPECYHGKDLVVHPGTVSAMATLGIKTSEDRAQAKAEIVEVLTHLSQVK